MNKATNKNGLFIDTGLLRDHVSRLREEKKLASRLYDNVVAMKAANDPTIAYRFDSVLRDIEQMIEYFDAMAKQLTRIEEEAVCLSRELKNVIDNSTERTQCVTDGRIVL